VKQSNKALGCNQNNELNDAQTELRRTAAMDDNSIKVYNYYK